MDILNAIFHIYLHFFFFFVIFVLPLSVYVLDEVVGLDFVDVFTKDLEAMEDCRQIGSEWLVSKEYVIPEEEDGVS